MVALAAIGWTAAASADNPHGTPPGQQKQTVSTSTTTGASATVQANGHGQVNGSAAAHTSTKAHGHAKAGVKASGHAGDHAQGSVGAHAGVKANAHATGKAKANVHAGGRAHTTVHASAQSHNTVAAATSNQTKVYGNGSTAGQVAVSSGFGSATLHGPGNSQPHKTGCGKHTVDVHALNAKAGACGTAGVSARVHGHARGKLKASGHGSKAVTAALGLGVKPSNVTAHNTFAAALSNLTKLYGNGKTAGQIAIQAGFGAAMLFGPGNSQPHKVMCGGHMVDVHALKAHGRACTTSGAGAGMTGNVSPVVSAQTPVVAAPVVAVTAKKSSPVAATKNRVQGAPASNKAKQKPGAGVLGAGRQFISATKPLGRALLAAPRTGTLPFTGLALWLPLALGAALIVGGYGLRRKANALS